jgi:Rad3-related DNA helicase
LQAAGRVIRTESDRGVVLLIDDRFGEPDYRRLIPAHWRGLHYVGDGQALTRLLTAFWQGGTQ